MTYRVVWRPGLAARVEQHAFLARETGRDSAAITAAVARVNRLLAAAPQTEGESRSGSERVLIVPPVSATYEPFPEAGVVLIYGAVIYPGRRV